MPRGTKQPKGSDQPNNHHIKKEELDLSMDSTRGQWSTNQQFGVTKLILYKNSPYQLNTILYFQFSKSKEYNR